MSDANIPHLAFEGIGFLVRRAPGFDLAVAAAMCPPATHVLIAGGASHGVLLAAVLGESVRGSTWMRNVLRRRLIRLGAIR